MKVVKKNGVNYSMSSIASGFDFSDEQFIQKFRNL